MTARRFLLFSILCSSVLVRNSTSDLFLNNGIVSTFSAIQKLLSYFENHYKEVNLDVVFGLRVIEGQCKLLIEEHENGQLQLSSEDLVKQISSVGAEAGKLANMAIPHVHEQDREYFKQMKQLTVGAWKVFHPQRIVNPMMRWNTLPKNIGFTADFSDHCLSDLMVGTKENPKPCHLTEDCLNTMFTAGQAGYYLQHQIFYTILAQKMGCEKAVSEYLVARTNFRSLEQVQHEFCTNAYYELDDVASLYGSNLQYRNLFLEMEFLCPSIGYFQFMKSSWLDDIVSWQSADGCFPASVSSVAAGSTGNNTGNHETTEIGGAGVVSPSNLAPQPELPNIPPPPGFDRDEVAHHPKGAARDEAPPAPNYVVLDSPSVDVGQKEVASLPRRPSIVLGPDSPMRDETGGAAHSVVDPNHVGHQIRGYLDNNINELHRDSMARVWPTMYDSQWVQRQSNALNLHPVALGGGDQYARQQPQQFQFNNDVAYAAAQPHGSVGFRRVGAPQVVPYHHDGGQFGMPQSALTGYRMVPGDDTRRVVAPIADGKGGDDDSRSDQYRQGRGLKSAVELSPPTRDGGSAAHAFLFKDKNLSGGCLAHFTSFATAALAMYLRYLVDEGPPEFTHLRLENFRRSSSAAAKTPQSSSPYAVVVTNDTQHLRVRVGNDGAPDGILPVSQPSPPPSLQDMDSRARNYMGTYRRQYDSKFRPIYVGPMGHADLTRGAGGIQADYVHQAEVRKDLPDWTVPYVAEPSVAPANGSKRSRFPVTRVSQSKVVVGEGGNQVSGEIPLQVQVIEFTPLQRDLDHYLVAMAVVSVVFVLIIFRYFRRRRNRIMRMKARHL